MTSASGNGDDERIALFLDFENLAIGARDGLGIDPLAFGPIADALAERGRVVARRAYADWSAFDADRRQLARAHVELIEIPQRIGGSRKNSADIKLAVDAIELAYERGFITTFAIGTGDSDFTPLVHKLRELDKRVIGIGVESSTSKLLPPACDEFLFYDRLPGVEPGQPVRRSRRPRGESADPRPATPSPAPVTGSAPVRPEPAATAEIAPAAAPRSPFADPFAVPGEAAATEQDVQRLVTTTLTGLQRHATGPVLVSRVKRAILRKDPTFDESDHGFRGFSELMRHLAESGVVDLTAGAAPGDPEVSFPQATSADDHAFRLLVDVVREMSAGGERPQLSGLKDQLRKREPDFSEKRHGFATFLSFVKAARARGLVELDDPDASGEYRLGLPG